jgi:hypothetical protein
MLALDALRRIGYQFSHSLQQDGIRATTLQASALEVRSGEIQKGIIAKAIGVALAQSARSR